MALEIVEITSPDDPKIEQVIDIFARAFMGTTANSAMFPHGLTPTLVRTFYERERNGLAIGKGLRLYCVMDTDANEMISAGKWRIEEELSLPDAEKKKVDWPAEVNLAATETFMSANDTARERLMAKQRHMHVKVLASARAHERRGGATMLMKLALKQADEAGLATFLESTSIGRPFYEKLGFENKADIHIDFRPCGYDGIAVQFSMVREPGPMAASS